MADRSCYAWCRGRPSSALRTWSSCSPRPRTRCRPELTARLEHLGLIAARALRARPSARGRADADPARRALRARQDDDGRHRRRAREGRPRRAPPLPHRPARADHRRDRGGRGAGRAAATPSSRASTPTSSARCRTTSATSFVERARAAVDGRLAASAGLRAARAAPARRIDPELDRLLVRSSATVPPVSTNQEATPMTPRTRDSRWLALVVLCAGMLMVILDQTIVNVALPSIQADLGFSAVRPRLGRQRVPDRVRRPAAARRPARRPDRAPARSSSPASPSSRSPRCCAGCRGSPEMLIAARFVQGVGGALSSAVILGMIVTMFPEPRRAGEGDRRLQLRRLGGRVDRPAGRRRPDPGARLALDLLRQRADRRSPRWCFGRAPARARARPRPARGRRRPRRRPGHRRADARRLHDRRRALARCWASSPSRCWPRSSSARRPPRGRCCGCASCAPATSPARTSRRC